VAQKPSTGTRDLAQRLDEALEQQAASAEILRLIATSPTDVQPVFDAVVASAARLCHAEFSAVIGLDGEVLHLVALNNMSSAELQAWHELFPRRPQRDFIMGRAFVDNRVVHIEDVLNDPDYDLRTHGKILRLSRYRTFLGVPIVRDGRPIGVIGCGRREVRPFTSAEIELVRTFADQAAIAIENVRLVQALGERNRDLSRSLEQQTATAEILRVISRSPTDVQPVFDSIVASAVTLCEAFVGNVYRFDGELIHFVAHHNFTPEALAVTQQLFPTVPHRDNATARAILDRDVVHIPDVTEDPEYLNRDWARALGIRSVLSVPMLRDGTPIGAITVSRTQPGRFSDSHLALLQTFADQAVIAIENVRLFTEVQERNRELTQTLEQQTATSDILRVISSSPTDAQPVFETIAQSAARLCNAHSCFVFRFDGSLVHFVAHHGLTPAGHEAVRRAWPMTPSRGTAVGRAILDRGVAHIPDVHVDPSYVLGEVAQVATYRSTVAVPMLRDGVPIGAISILRSEAGAFPERQIALLNTFADQAVIAIENVRLFQELETRNHALTETLEQQTATGEILKVISSSPGDSQPMFDMMARSAARLCGAEVCLVYRFDGEMIHFVAHHGMAPSAVGGFRTAFPASPSRGSATGRAILDRVVVEIPDVTADAEYTLSATMVADLRSTVAVPIMRDGRPVGTINLSRARAGTFPARHIDLLRTFADQAAIAIENVRLFTEVQTRNQELTETLEQQTATSEILRIIASSPTDAQPVFDTIATNALRLCNASWSAVVRFDGHQMELASLHGLTDPHAIDATRHAFPRVPQPGGATDRAILSRAVANIPDVLSEPGYRHRDLARAANYRSHLSVPMLRDGHPVGAVTVAGAAPGAFSDRQVELLKTFADQAVIAIENVRLFQELQVRTADLTRSVGELRALSEVSQAVSSVLDLKTVLETIVTRAVQLSGSHSGIVYEFDETAQTFHARATHRVTPEHLDAIRAAPIRLGEGAVGRAGVSREPVQVGDIEGEQELVAPQTRKLLTRDGMRSLLALPLVREGHLLGGLVIMRREYGAFAPDVVTMLQTFATQSVLAIHNAGLFREIQRQKQYSEALVQTSPVAIATMDLEDRVVGWNPGAERLFGYSEREAIGCHVDDLIATSELREEVRANARQTLAGQRIRTITRRARKDGTLVDVEVSSVPIVVDGAEVGFIAIYHDISELLEARRAAEAANEAKSAFLATMSHEIRTPMNAVIGMTGLLLNTSLTEEQRDYAEVVRQSGDALLSVINDILDFSKIEAGKLELESQPFDVRECLESALDLVATRAAEKGLDLAYLLPEGAPAAIVGDVTRLRQILLNLLSNAVKFTEKGEVVLSVSARRADEAGQTYELTFAARDTGIGIPPDRLDLLFQSFSQVDTSTTRRYGGTGLGLAISQRLAEMMGGRIAVTSAVGVGSDFRFTVRAAVAASPVPTRRDLTGVQPSLRGKRVLVVDDNETNRRILTSHLGAWGMLARATGSPREALAWMDADERFDLGILDMHMPEMDGVALARAIRDRAGAATPLVLFTSLGRREARADSEGFAAYLHKPIKPSQLFDTLASVLADQPVHVPQRGTLRTEFDPDMARRHPLRILLAEDNVVNQKLALRLLDQMGYRADVAANGLEAIDAIERQTYDVVLMDVQMPELDGFEASREINRRWPGTRRPRIVAMTANAMEGDRELCTAAGMDDYVAKPVRVEDLVAALERSGRRLDGDAGGAATTVDGAEARPDGGVEMPDASTAAVDRPRFQALARTMGGAFVAELVDTYAEDARLLIAALRRGLTDGDVDGFRRAAHSLKSNSETLGATRLAALARDLEATARAGHLDGAGPRVEQVAQDYELVARELAELRRGLSA
jgi:PAS domain S-box-containing protein